MSEFFDEFSHCECPRRICYLRLAPLCFVEARTLKLIKAKKLVSVASFRCALAYKDYDMRGTALLCLANYVILEAIKVRMDEVVVVAELKLGRIIASFKNVVFFPLNCMLHRLQAAARFQIV